MTIAELALKKIIEVYEDKDDNLTAKVNMELIPEECSAEGDILSMVFSDGSEMKLDLWDCNTDYDGSGVSLNAKDGTYVYIS